MTAQRSSPPDRRATQRGRAGGRSRRARLLLGLACTTALVTAACSSDKPSGATDGPVGPTTTEAGGGTETSVITTDGVVTPKSGGTLTMLRSGGTPATWDPADPSNDGMQLPNGTG